MKGDRGDEKQSHAGIKSKLEENAEDFGGFLPHFLSKGSKNKKGGKERRKVDRITLEK